MIQSVFQHIDVARLAGFNRFVGVDLTERRSRVVVLRNRHGLPSRYNARFVAETAFTVEFSPGLTAEQKGEELRMGLLHAGVTARWAVSSVRSIGVKIVTAHVPSPAEDIGEWIKENYEKLIQLPLPIDMIAFRYEILERTDHGTAIEIAFVRTADLDACKRTLKAAGLALVAVGAGVMDALNALLLTTPLAGRGECSFVYSEEGTEWVFRVRDGKRTAMHIPAPGEPAGASMPTGVVFRGGDTTNSGSGQNVIRPFGLSSEYSLAAGLALKGFIPELNPMDLLDEAEQERFDGMVHRALARRVTIALGVTLVLLLTLPGAVSFISGSQAVTLENDVIPGSSYAEIESLQQQVDFLENDLYDNTQTSARTGFSRILHDVAAAVPESVWLTKLKIEGRSQESALVTLTGISRSGDQVSLFIRALEGPCSGVRLIRFGSQEGRYPADSKPSGSPFFEISAIMSNK